MDTPIVPTQIRKIYEGRIFTLQVETIQLPKGGTLRAEIVRHHGSVVIVPVADDGRIVLVRQYRHAIGVQVWEIPAGSLKPGEDIEAAAIRECHEETGLVPRRLERLGAFFPTPGYCDEEMHFFRASGLREPAAHERAEQDEDEDIEARAYSIGELRAMIASGDIIDLKTVAGLWLVEAAGRT